MKEKITTDLTYEELAYKLEQMRDDMLLYDGGVSKALYLQMAADALRGAEYLACYGTQIGGGKVLYICDCKRNTNCQKSNCRYTGYGDCMMTRNFWKRRKWNHEKGAWDDDSTGA